MMIYGSVRAGFRDYLFQGIIVCEPARLYLQELNRDRV